MKKLISIFLSLVLMLGITVPASAAGIGPITTGPIETDAEKLARVRAEVLSGNITNEQDVIEVALMQYSANIASSPTAITNNTDGSANDLLTISQKVDSYLDENNNIVDQYVCTGLVLTDEHGDIVPAAEAYQYHSGSNSNSITSLNLRATVTLSLKSKFESGQRWYTPNYVKTTINDAAVAINTLRQAYTYYDETMNNPSITYSFVETAPTEGQSFYFYPYNDWHHAMGTLSPQHGGRAYIYTNSGTLRVGVVGSFSGNYVYFNADYDFQMYG